MSVDYQVLLRLMQMQNSLSAKIYGIPEEVYRCVGCAKVKEIFDEFEIPYEFVDVIYMEKEVHYNYKAIEEAAKICGVWPSKRVNYPVVLLGGVYYPNLRTIKHRLGELGYDLDLLD